MALSDAIEAVQERDLQFCTSSVSSNSMSKVYGDLSNMVLSSGSRRKPRAIAVVYTVLEISWTSSPLPDQQLEVGGFFSLALGYLFNNLWLLGEVLSIFVSQL